MRDPKERILDILEAIERILSKTTRGRSAFEADELIQTWVIHHLEIIGEAAGKLAPAFHEAYPAIPWSRIVAMRNILVHEYFGIDLDEVWNVVERELPQLKDVLNQLLAEM